uniref:Myb-like domain-containing protein n=1 Tax=Knipowitschia caucasica TaxID=637954 RepID=A0AAV2MHF2_KNICA
MENVATASRGFVWTDEEVELLLRVTLEYKTTKCQENVDWESCQSKYKDIYEDFVRQYPQGRQDEFPHSNGEITSKAQITSKLKAVRTKYRKAVDTGKRSGQGRVVFIFFELCQQVWGGSPATETIAAKLDGHRREKLKRKLDSDSFVEEDLRIKRRMLELAEVAEINSKLQMAELTSEMRKLHGSISEGLSILRQLTPQSQFNSPYPHGQLAYADVHRLPSGFSPHGFSTPGPMHHPSAVSTPRLSPSFHNPQQGQGPSYRRMLMREDTIEELDFTY